MKYLKKFESVNISDQDHINTIKDVFQDIFDEWGIEETNLCPGAGLYWCIYNSQNEEYEDTFDLYIRKYNRGGGRVDMPDIDISGHIKTLQSMGYLVNVEPEDDPKYYIIVIKPENN